MKTTLLTLILFLLFSQTSLTTEIRTTMLFQDLTRNEQGASINPTPIEWEFESDFVGNITDSVRRSSDGFYTFEHANADENLVLSHYVYSDEWTIWDIEISRQHTNIRQRLTVSPILYEEPVSFTRLWHAHNNDPEQDYRVRITFPPGQSNFVHFASRITDAVGATTRFRISEYDNSNFVDPIPGDTNVDGSVSFNDFLTLSENFAHRPTVWMQGDFDGNGTVQFADFLTLSGNFGRDISGIGDTVAVPEPSSLVLIIGFIGVLGHGRKKRQA